MEVGAVNNVKMLAEVIVTVNVTVVRITAEDAMAIVLTAVLVPPIVTRSVIQGVAP